MRFVVALYHQEWAAPTAPPAGPEGDLLVMKPITSESRSPWLPATAPGRAAGVLIVVGLAAAVVATLVGVLFWLAAAMILAGVVMAAVAAAQGERSLAVLVPAVLVAAIAIGFAVAELAG